MNICMQQAQYDCFLASLATAFQLNYHDTFPQDFIDKIEAKKGVYGDEIDEAFRLAGLNDGTDYWTVYVADISQTKVKRLLEGRRALLQVPSLNHAGKQHIVCWMGETLYDPSNLQTYSCLDQLLIQYVWIFNENPLIRKG